MSDLSPFLNRQPPNPKPTGQLASPRYNPVIKNLENSFKLPPKNPPVRIKFPPLPRIPAGRIGGGIAAFLLNEFLFPEAVADGTIPAHLRVPEPPVEIEPPKAPFKGGQGNGSLYRIVIDMHRRNYPSPPYSPTELGSTVRLDFIVWGPITQITAEYSPIQPNSIYVTPQIAVNCRGIYRNDSDPPTSVNHREPQEFGTYYQGSGGEDWRYLPDLDYSIISIEWVGGALEGEAGLPPGSTPPSYSPPGIYIGNPSEPGNEPPPPQPLPPPIIIYRPSPLPNSNPNNPTNPTPTPQPTPIGQPNPTPSGTPEPPPQPNPNTGPTPTPTNVPPAILRGPWANPTPTPISKPGYNPGFTPTFTPNPIQPHPGFSPNPIQVKPATPITPLPTTGQPITTNNPTRTPTPEPVKPVTPPTPEPPIINPDIKNVWDEAIKIGTGIVVIKQIAEGIATNVAPEAITTAAAAGTCRTTQPGGCTSNLVNNAANTINQNTNGKIDGLSAGNALANAEQLRLLNILDNKLGAQIPSLGIGGKLSNFVNWSVADRVMNLVTMFATLHNVMMLSNSVKETFLDVLDNLFQTGFNIAPNLFKKADGDEAIEAREYFGQILDNFFGSLFGVTEWTALKAQWKAFSTISSSAAQAYNNLREIHNDSQELLNMARNYTAELGNALVDEGIISEDNWEHKDPKQKIKSKALGRLQKMGQGLEDLDNKLEAIEQVTATLLNITNTAKEIKENVEAFDKGIEEFNKAAKQRRDTEVEGLELPDFSLEDLF